MTFPVSFHLGALSLKAHLVFELLAYFIGYQYYRRLRKGRGDYLDDSNRLWVITGGILGAAMLSKLLGLLEHPDLFRLSLDNLAYIAASKTIAGGLLGAVIGVEITKKCLGITRSTGDLFCYPTIAGIMIGRIGCFLEGVGDGTWGNPTEFLLGMNGGDGIARHPTPLYEITALGCIWAMLYWLERRFPLREGSLFKVFITTYLIWRLAIEFLKPVYVYPFGLSAIQLACALGLFYYRSVILHPRSLLRN